MKILHVVQDLEMARVPSSAFHSFAQNVTVAWAGSPASALEWLQQNTDASAVIVEVEAQSGAPFVREIRAARLDTPVVVVGGSGRLDTAIAALNSGADGYLPAGPFLERELPDLVAQAMERANSRARERTEMSAELATQRRQLAREGRACAALQQQSLQLEHALGKLEQRRAREAAGFAELLDVRRRAFDERYAHVSESRDALVADLAAARSGLEREREARVADRDAARAAHEESERRYADEIAAAVARFTDLESRHDAVLEQHAAVTREHDAAYAALERSVAEARSNYQALFERAAADRAAADQLLQSRDALVADLAAARSALEREREARAEAEAARATSEGLLTQERQRRADLEQDVAMLRAVHMESKRRHADEIAAAAAQYVDLEARHHATLEQHAGVTAEHDIARAALERNAAEAQSNYQALFERAEAERAVSEQVLQSRDALAAELAAARSALEREREAARAARDDSERRHADEIAAAGARLAHLESRHHAALEEHAAVTKEHDVAYAALERNLAEAQSNYQTLLERVAADRALAEEELAVAVAGRQQSEHRANRIIAAALTREAELIAAVETESAAKAVAESQASAARMAAARGRDRSLLVVSTYRQRVRAERLGRESDLRRATAETERLQLSFDELQSAARQLDEVAAEHAAARSQLESLVGERDRQLAEEMERHLAAQEDAERALAGLRNDVDTLRREIADTRARAEALQHVADRVPDLEVQLERSRQEKRRQFERAPYGLCRFSTDGTTIDANHSFVALLGYRRSENLRDLSWLTAAKERTGDLGWLLERARATRKAETVETQWTAREGRRVIVRLQALLTSDGAIEIVAEDITALRALEGRLRQAQKMEAVGRLASEVAVTCDAVLGDVAREAREWIEKLQSVDLRIPAERMVEEVTRARGFLRRLDSYGDEQKRALEPVSAQRVLRDLAPVLKRLVGERISLVLPKSAGLFPVDVDAERLERVLTNVAGYARQRMPMGGQVRIDLATIAIGRRFADAHSNVRAGDHVLITVTELPEAGVRRADAPSDARAVDIAGMELGVLVELISSCGGHLWLEAQPAGNMVVKIHLPRLPIKEQRGGRLSQWLRAASVANIVT